MDKALPCKIFILIGFKEKVFTHINSQQMWMNFKTFSSSSRVDCAIQLNFNLDAVDKGWKLLSGGGGGEQLAVKAKYTCVSPVYR